MRVATISGPLMLEFESMEARDAAITRITPLLTGGHHSSKPIGNSIEPTGPMASVKKQLLEEDRCRLLLIRTYFPATFLAYDLSSKWTRGMLSKSLYIFAYPVRKSLQVLIPQSLFKAILQVISCFSTSNCV